ncbi:beta-1,3-galactosyltransferase brn-like [Clavelina lepadiformis]|uniref:beta-1,3-galactosyltransferase brn-like n=1 Tax=Clavelina lepadiformis TaxID=159417 RepID=UPI0040414EAB
MTFFVGRNKKLKFFAIVLGLVVWSFLVITMQVRRTNRHHQSSKARQKNAAINTPATQREMTLQAKDISYSNTTDAPISFSSETTSISSKSYEFLQEPTFFSNREINSCLLGKNISWSMIIFIKSAASYGRRREWIRKTWGSIGYLDGVTFQTIFVTGQTDARTQALLDEEHSRYGDILQVDASDAYLDVGLKTLSGMQWTSDKLPRQYFYSSGDDDMMIDLVKLKEAVDENIAKISDENWPEFPIICTYETKESSHPIRDKQDKNFISVQDYSEPNWPKFCLGGFYTTSVRVIRQLWEASLTSKRINTDDVFITGILRQKIGMPDEMVVPGISETCQHLGGFFENKFKTMWSERKMKFENKSICFKL